MPGYSKLTKKGYRSRYREEMAVFPQPEEGGGLGVWRYLDLAKFVSLLSTKTLIFSRVDCLRDDYEDLLRRHSHLKLKSDPGRAKRFAEFQTKVRPHTYVTCWHANSDESEAMWRLYCGANEGVAIKTSYEKLDASLPRRNSGTTASGFAMLGLSPNVQMRPLRNV